MSVCPSVSMSPAVHLPNGALDTFFLRSSGVGGGGRPRTVHRREAQLVLGLRQVAVRGLPAVLRGASKPSEAWTQGHRALATTLAFGVLNYWTVSACSTALAAV